MYIDSPEDKNVKKKNKWLVINGKHNRLGIWKAVNFNLRNGKNQTCRTDINKTNNGKKTCKRDWSKTKGHKQKNDFIVNQYHLKILIRVRYKSSLMVDFDDYLL